MRNASALIAALLVASQLVPTSGQSAAGSSAAIEYGQLVAQARAADAERREGLARAGKAGADEHHLESPDFQRKLAVAEARYVEMVGQYAAASGLPQVALRLSNWPHRGPISSPFAPRWGGFHNGMDIAAPFFTPVHATADGIVTVVGRPYATSGDLAMTVHIVHGGNLATVYVHLDDRQRPVVKVGDRVTAGQLIAYVGTTGWSTGPHTHFMTVVNGRAVDPMGLLPP
jgi:murein DD-endopeptidase MepM/ murein hydrolase activator NlpD